MHVYVHRYKPSKPYLYSLQEVFNLCQQGPEVTEEGGGAVVVVKEICHLLDLFPVLGES